MKKKAQNHVVLRGCVNVLQGIKGKDDVVFEYLNIIAWRQIFHVWFIQTTMRGGPLSQNKGPPSFNCYRAPKFILSPLCVCVALACVCGMYVCGFCVPWHSVLGASASEVRPRSV